MYYIVLNIMYIKRILVFKMCLNFIMYVFNNFWIVNYMNIVVCYLL